MSETAPRRSYQKPKSMLQQALGEDAAPETEAAPQAASEPAAPVREPMRRPMREEDPRARAAKRAAEIRGHLGGDLDDGVDEFYIPQHLIPDGWSYEWKRRTVLNQEDPAYQVSLARKGWEPVPASRHPEMMPSGASYNDIERKGMVLMERPKDITDEAIDIEKRNARRQMRQKEQQLNSAPDGQFDRNHPQARARISKGYEPMAIPRDE